jgi:dUTP pyrophosphatase
MTTPETLKIPLTRCGAVWVPLPAYQTAGSAGMDLHAALSERVVLSPGERRLIPTGLKIAVPVGFEAQVRPRSSLALRHGITVLNAPGTIDSDFRGEIGVVLIHHGQEAFELKPLERIAQLVIQRVLIASWDEVSQLDETARGEGGYGSTGNR